VASPSFVAKGTFASGIGTVSPGMPAGISTDDLLLLFVHSANQAIAAPTNNSWTEITPSGSPFRGTAGAAGGVRLQIFYRFVDGSEVLETVPDSGDITAAIILAYTNVNTTTPFDGVTAVGYNAVASTTLTMTGITTSTNEAMVVHGVALDLDSA